MLKRPLNLYEKATEAATIHQYPGKATGHHLTSCGMDKDAKKMIVVAKGDDCNLGDNGNFASNDVDVIMAEIEMITQQPKRVLQSLTQVESS